MLFVGRTRYRLPLPPRARAEVRGARKRARRARARFRRCPAPPPGDRTFTLVPPFRLRRLDGLAFWLALPSRTARLLREFRPDAVVCQTAYDAAAALLARRIARVPARIVVEVHGDWRTSTRLYGSPARRGLGRLGDAVAAAALRRADAVRTVSPFTAGLVRGARPRAGRRLPGVHGPRAVRRAGAPLPSEPVALFVGVLEAYKNVDGLAARVAARRAARPGRLAAPRRRGHAYRCGRGARPRARSALGPRALVRRRSRRRSTTRGCSCCRRARRGWAACSSRRSVAAAASSGRAPARSPTSSPTASAVCSSSRTIPLRLPTRSSRVLSDRALAERLGAGARAAAAPWLQTPAEYARRMRELVT